MPVINLRSVMVAAAAVINLRFITAAAKQFITDILQLPNYRFVMSTNL